MNSFFDIFLDFCFVLFQAFQTFWNYAMTNQILTFSFGLGVMAIALNLTVDIMAQKSGEDNDK